ncbi:MAG: ferritin-like domain-containing protein [Proteobacteria bacterium]|nr:ferritin-like domain-containing protein [Pseudomonadota bacterium]MCP4919383.1 ferritin-like domain-containing protein [Pseudomonadota bacterium]
MRHIQKVWAQRTLAEYRSACLTAELQHWLLVIAVSPDTLDVCHRIVMDEVAHAELSREAFLAAGGDPAALPLARDTLFLPHDVEAPLEYRALSVAADVFCCGETVAVPLFLALREDATEAPAIEALDRIVRDEATHRAFGWTLLDELLERLPDGVVWLQQRAPEFVRRIADAYDGYGSTTVDQGPEWGLMPPVRYGEITRQCIDEVIRPRFAKRGVTV